MQPKNPHSTGRSGVGALHIREGDVADAEAVEAVHYAAREAVYDGRVADWPPPGPDRAGRIERWEEWLADPLISSVIGEAEGEIVGFCTIRPSEGESAEEGEDDRVAEMPTLYVHPDVWHLGHGQALCAAGLERARERGFRTLTLWVLEVNGRAREFYKEFGFVPDGETKVDEMTTERLVAFRYRISLTDPSAWRS